MTDTERLALAIAILTAQLAALAAEVHRLAKEVQDCKDVYRNCACFGVNPTEVT